MNSKIKNLILFVSIGLILSLLYLFFIKKDNKEATLITSQTNNSQNTLNNNLGLSEDGEIEIESDKKLIYRLGLVNKNTSVNRKNINEESREIISVLSNINNIVLDNSLFSKSFFNTLVDRTEILTPEEDIGRDNPFEPSSGNLNSLFNTNREDFNLFN